MKEINLFMGRVEFQYFPQKEIEFILIKASSPTEAFDILYEHTKKDDMVVNISIMPTLTPKATEK